MAFRNQWVWVMGMMVALAAIGQGCAKTPTMAERNVIVSLDESLARATAVEVNLIGANATEYTQLAGMGVDDYWRTAAAGRARGTRYVMKLSGNDRTKTLLKTDPIWQKWRSEGAMHLITIAFVPGLTGSGAGDLDPRRVVLPLDKHRWANLEDIRINVSQSGLNVPTQPLPAKQ
jgi:hypothetical protein